MASASSREEGSTMFCKAVAEGDLNKCQQLLQEHPYLLHIASSPYSTNCLHIATLKMHSGIVDEILRRNKMLARDLDSQKRSALHIAAAGGHVGIASKLLACAPEMIWSCDSQGMNPIHVAAMCGHSRMLKMLVRYDRAPAMKRVCHGRTILHLCVLHGQLDALKVLMDDVGLGELGVAKDNDGDTVLHLAIRHKHVEVMKYLVRSNNVDKSSMNSKGETALEIMVKTLSDPDETDIFNRINPITLYLSIVVGTTALVVLSKLSIESIP